MAAIPAIGIFKRFIGIFHFAIKISQPSPSHRGFAGPIN
jgi:hypothetical protein